MKKLALETRKLAALIALFAGASTAFYSLSSTAADDKSKAPTAKPALTVTAVKPMQTRLPISVVANGNIAAWQEAIVGSEANGLRLKEVRVNVGDYVKAGQVLAVFAPETIQADLAQVRANVLEAQATAADAAGNAQRARGLQTSGALSAQQINQYNTAEQTANARVEAAKATLAVQELRLRQTQVLAPDSGVISARAATVGSVVGAGTELFRLVRQGRLEWRADVTAQEVDRIKPGMNVTVTTPSGAQVKGRVRIIAPTVDVQTRNTLVYVDLPGSAAGISPVRAGMFARGEFDIGGSNAMTVPQQSVILRDGFSYVFRLNEQDRVAQLKVKTGRRVGDQVEILEGLAADARVVLQGAGFLNDGDLVRVVATGPTAGTATTPTSAATPTQTPTATKP